MHNVYIGPDVIFLPSADADVYADTKILTSADADADILNRIRADADADIL